MSSWALGDDGDLVVQNGSLLRVGGRSAIAQDIVCRLRFIKGEWYQNRDAGVPWYEEVFDGYPSEAGLRALFTRVVRETPGVVSVDSLSITIDSAQRTLNLDIAAITEDGDAIVLDHVELKL